MVVVVAGWVVVVAGWVVVVARGAVVVVGAVLSTDAPVVELEGGASTGSSKHEDPPRKPRERVRSKTAALRMIGKSLVGEEKLEAPYQAGPSRIFVSWFHQ